MESPLDQLYQDIRLLEAEQTLRGIYDANAALYRSQLGRDLTVLTGAAAIAGLQYFAEDSGFPIMASLVGALAFGQALNDGIKLWYNNHKAHRFACYVELDRERLEELLS